MRFRHCCRINAVSGIGVSPFGHLRIKGCSPPPRSLSQARHVLHRFSKPRHPPYALFSSTQINTHSSLIWTHCSVPRNKPAIRNALLLLNFQYAVFHPQVSVSRRIPALDMTDIRRPASYNPAPKKRKTALYAAPFQHLRWRRYYAWESRLPLSFSRFNIVLVLYSRTISCQHL